MNIVKTMTGNFAVSALRESSNYSYLPLNSGSKSERM